MITTLSLSPTVDKIYYIDDFKAGGLFRTADTVKSAGGKGINVSRVAALLGEKPCCLGFKAGHTGGWLESELVKLGVKTEFIPVEGESRTNSNIIDRARGVETEILETGPIIREEDRKKFIELFCRVINGTRVLVCSGGLPQGIPSAFYKELILMAKSSGARVILDTSGEVLEKGIEAKPYLIKPNKRELGNLVGRELGSIEEVICASRSVNEKGVPFVAASLGKEGALLVSAERAVHISPPEVEVVNTIGCGDSMVSGLATGIYRGMELSEAFLLGAACSVANTQFAEIGWITKELVEKYIKLLKVMEY